VQEQQKNSSDRVWLRPLEAAEYTALNRTTLWRAARRGDLRVGGIKHAPRFFRDDLDDFMRRGDSRWDQ
jgi:hypothetical protein